MATILVTGIAGQIGSQVAKALIARGDTVVGVDNLSDYYDVALKEARLAFIRESGDFVFVKASVADQEAMEKVFSEHKIDKVCHMAAQAGVRYSLENPFAYEESNNKGTLVMLEACRKHKVKDFIYASSSSVYGGNEKLPFSEEDNVDNAISVYAATKKYNEVVAHVYHQLYGLNCTGLRFFTVYGPFGRPDMAIFKFTKNIMEGKPIDVYNNGKHRRDFTYVNDITTGVVAALDKAYPYEIFNLARGETVTLGEFIAAIEETAGKKADKNMLPKQPGDIEATSADISKARKMLGYEPRTSIKEGVSKFVDWYKEYYKVDS